MKSFYGKNSQSGVSISKVSKATVIGNIKSLFASSASMTSVLLPKNTDMY